MGNDREDIIKKFLTGVLSNEVSSFLSPVHSDRGLQEGVVKGIGLTRPLIEIVEPPFETKGALLTSVDGFEALSRDGVFDDPYLEQSRRIFTEAFPDESKSYFHGGLLGVDSTARIITLGEVNVRNYLAREAKRLYERSHENGG